MPPHTYPPALQAADDSATNATNPYTTNLSNRTAVVEAPIGSGTAIVRAIDSTVLPGLASSGLSIHQVTLPACTGLAPHYHPTADELQYVLTGELAGARLPVSPGCPCCPCT